jgi:hypothetical protein
MSSQREARSGEQPVLPTRKEASKSQIYSAGFTEQKYFSSNRQSNQHHSLSSRKRSHYTDYAIVNQCGGQHVIQLNGRNTSRSVIQSKVKPSLYRPEQTLRVPQEWGSQISTRSGHEVGRVVRPAHLPHLSPRKYFWYLFMLRSCVNLRAIVRKEGLYQWKIPMTRSGMEPVLSQQTALRVPM